MHEVEHHKLIYEGYWYMYLLHFHKENVLVDLLRLSLLKIVFSLKQVGLCMMFVRLKDVQKSLIAIEFVSILRMFAL